MAKRFQPMKEFGRSMKKPKLDISTNSRTTSNAGIRIESAKATKVRIISPIKNSTNEFWDDEDDDVILLATQVAEAAVAAERVCSGAKELQYNTMNISEITFSEFANAATTSTQHQAASKEEKSDILSQMLQDDDDDFELLAAVQMSDSVEFKKPAPPPSTHLMVTAAQKPIKIAHQLPASRGSEDVVEFVLSQNTGPDSTLPSSQSAARRQLASERQIKFLMERIDVLKKENSKLNKDLLETKSKMSSKEGEASLLRDELRHLKQQAQTLKMEKILSAKHAQNECQSKMDELAKAVQAKEAEVRMKEMEYSLVKMRYDDDTQRFQQSFCEESIRQRKGENPISSLPTIQQRRLKKCLMKMPSWDVYETQLECTKYRIHPLVYEKSMDRGSSKKQRSVFQIELENIQTRLSQLQLLEPKNLPENFSNYCVDSISKVLPEFWSYTHSLEFPKNRRIHPYHEYSLSNKKCSPRSEDFIRCLQEPFELYDDERCLCLRRYLAALSIICQQVPELASSVLNHRHDDYHILQIVTDSVVKLGFAREICEHFGVLEALAVWLNSLMLHVSSNTPVNILEMLVDLLKSLIFARPSAWIFQKISICIRQSCKLPNALELFCVNSSESTFVADRVRSTYRFSNDSCLMQVYCGLLEIAFPLSVRLDFIHFKLLVLICLNHVHFAYQCFQRPPNFIQKLIPSYDDEDVDSEKQSDTSYNSKMISESTEQSSKNSETNSNISSTTTSPSRVQGNVLESSNPRCECYVKLCLSVVTLVFQVLRQWLLQKKEYCTLQVGEISRLSVQLLHVIFCDNYLTSLFRVSEETTKHHLGLIVKWWSENSKQLQFNAINMKFLQKLQNSHVLPKEYTTDNVKHLKAPKNSEEAVNCASKLNLIQDASNKMKFFESLKGFAFNFQ